MTVTIQIPATLRTYCHDATSELVLSAATVRAALGQLDRSHPMLYRSICDETGMLRQHVNLFVNSTLLGRGQLMKYIFKPSDALWIMPAVSGG